MVADVRQNIKVARLCTQPPPMSFFRDSNPRSCIDTCRDPDLHLLSLRGNAFSIAKRARCTPSSGPAAVRTVLRELKPPSSLQHLAGALTRRALHDRAPRIARALAS